MEVTPLSHCTFRDGGTAEYVVRIDGVQTAVYRDYRLGSTTLGKWFDRQPQRAEATPLAPELAATMEAIYLKDHP